MLAVENDDDLAALVLDVFRQRYQLWRCTNGVLSCLHESSALLAVGDHGLRIPAITNRAVDLDASLKHIVYGSGLVSATFKIAAIWGEEALPEFFEWLAYRCSCELGNDEIERWIRRNAKGFRRLYPQLQDYLKFVDFVRFNDDHSISATITDDYH